MSSDIEKQIWRRAQYDNEQTCRRHWHDYSWTSFYRAWRWEVLYGQPKLDTSVQTWRTYQLRQRTRLEKILYDISTRARSLRQLPRFVIVPNSKHIDRGPVGYGDGWGRCRSQQLDKSIDIIMSTQRIMFRYKYFELHADRLQAQQSHPGLSQSLLSY